MSVRPARRAATDAEVAGAAAGYPGKSLSDKLDRHAKFLTDTPRLGAALWICWPKKTSPGFVDLTEGGVREALLPTGWVDVKVRAVDAD